MVEFKGNIDVLNNIPLQFSYKSVVCGKLLEVYASELSQKCPCCGTWYEIDEMSLAYWEPEENIYYKSREAHIDLKEWLKQEREQT